MDYKLPDNFMEIEDTKAVPAGLYTLRITDVDYVESQSSHIMQYVVKCDIPDNSSALPITTYLQDPGDPNSDVEKALRRIKGFLLAFGVQAEPGASLADIMQSLPGVTAQLPLRYEEDQTGKYGPKNSIQIPKF